MLDSFFEIKSISNFLIEYESKNTQRAYGRLLKRYFNWLEINPDDYIKSKRDFEEVFKEYFDIVEDAKETGATYRIPLTLSVAIMPSILTFLENHMFSC